MKKVKIAFLMLSLTVFCSYSALAVDYTINDDLVDQMFASAPETVNAAFTGLANAEAFASAGDKSAAAALLLDFFLGGLGIHRFYLGTEVLTGIGYIITCGGIFGIVPLVDFIVLIINVEDISPYVNNPKFFMWAN